MTTTIYTGKLAMASSESMVARKFGENIADAVIYML